MNDLTTTLKAGFVPSILAIQDSDTPHVKAFADYLSRNAGELTMGAVHDYLVELNASRYSAGMIRVKRQGAIQRVRQAFAGASLEDKAKLEAALADLNRDGATKAPMVNTFAVGLDKVISLEEYRKMLAWTRSDRLQLLVETLWLTGCRVSEILDVQPQDVREEGLLANLRVVGKGRKERHVRIPLGLLERIRETFGDGACLFATENGNRYSRCYVLNAIKRIGRGALGRSISAHSLRHSFATRIIAKTRKIEATSKYLGHSSPNITLAMYVHESLEATELLTDRELLGPRKAVVA